MTKNFLVQFEFDEHTSFWASDEELCKTLAVLLHSVAETQTRGPVPAVNVEPVTEVHKDLGLEVHGARGRTGAHAG